MVSEWPNQYTTWRPIFLKNFPWSSKWYDAPVTLTVGESNGLLNQSVRSSVHLGPKIPSVLWYIDGNCCGRISMHQFSHLAAGGSSPAGMAWWNRWVEVPNMTLRKSPLPWVPWASYLYQHDMEQPFNLGLKASLNGSINGTAAKTFPSPPVGKLRCV